MRYVRMIDNYIIVNNSNNYYSDNYYDSDFNIDGCHSRFSFLTTLRTFKTQSHVVTGNMGISPIYIGDNRNYYKFSGFISGCYYFMTVRTSRKIMLYL